MTESTALTTTSQQLATIDQEIQQFDFDWRRAQAFSRCKMVPVHFQTRPEDCMVAIMMARQLDINPLLALQNIQVINGRPGFSASFAIGLANQRGPFAGPITWESKGTGDKLQVTAKATVRETGEVVSVTVSMETAKAEGWVKNPKYRSMPEQMLRYRSATWLIRLHCPEVLLGFATDEEASTLAASPSREVKPVTVVDQTEAAPTSIVEDLNQQIRQKAEPAQVVEEPAAEPEVAEVDDPF